MTFNAKVLITGGCGFIGSHLVTALIQKDVDVVVLDNLAQEQTLHDLDFGRFPQNALL